MQPVAGDYNPAMSMLPVDTHDCDERAFEVFNDMRNASELMDAVVSDLKRFGVEDDSMVFGIRTALDEALQNAAHHGNLELDSSMRDEGIGVYLAAIMDRASREPYCQRKVYVSTRTTAKEARYVVRDEGSGFDVEAQLKRMARAKAEELSGRGLFMIHEYMDRVTFNAAGNELTMVKRLG